MWDIGQYNCLLSVDKDELQKGDTQACNKGDPEMHKILVGGHKALSKQRCEGINAAEERVEGNRPVKGATMGFKTF